MRDLANLNLSVGLGILANQVGTREGVAATGSFRETRKTIVEGQKIGYDKAVLNHDETEEEERRRAAIAQRKAELVAELVAELAAIEDRERRDH